MLILILATSCIFGGTPKHENFDESFKRLAFSFARHIENNKRVVVMNFTLKDPDEGNKTTGLDLYLAKRFTTNLVIAANGRFKVIDRKLGEATFAEDMKYEIQRRRPEEVLKDFQCDYYIMGEYLLRFKKIDFMQIVLINHSEIKHSEHIKFTLSDSEYQDFHELGMTDTVITTCEQKIKKLETKGGIVSMAHADALRVSLGLYKKAKHAPSDEFNLTKKLLIELLIVILTKI